MGDHRKVLESGTKGTTNNLQITRNFPNVVSPSFPTPVVGTYPPSPRFPKERGTLPMQQPSANASAWTLTTENYTGANTETCRGPSKRDTQDGDEPGFQDPSPEDSQSDKREPSTSGAGSLPQTEEKPSSFGQARRKLRVFKSSKSISAPQTCRDSSRTVERTTWSQLI